MYPANSQAKRDVSVSIQRLADLNLSAGRNQAARHAYLECLQIDRELANLDPPNVEAKRDVSVSVSVSVSLTNVADLDCNDGRFEEALRAYLEKLSIKRQLVKSDPTNTENQNELAVSLRKLAIDDLAIDPTEGRNLIGEAFAIYKRLNELDPKDERFAKNLQEIQSQRKTTN